MTFGFARLLPLAALMLVPLAATAEDYEFYHNPRFNFAVWVPTGLSSWESDNGDGITLMDEEGDLSIRAWGQFVSPGEIIDPYAATRSAMTDSGIEISYDRKGDNWFVLSGDQGGVTVYQYTIGLCDKSKSVSVRFDYVPSLQDQVGPMIEKAVETLGPYTGDCD